MIIKTEKPDNLLDLTLCQYDIFKGSEKYNLIRETLYGIVTISKDEEGNLIYQEPKEATVEIDYTDQDGITDRRVIRFFDVYDCLCKLVFEKVKLQLEVNSYMELHLSKINEVAIVYNIET